MDNTPATKADLERVLEAIASLRIDSQRWKDEILARNEAWKDELKTHFELVLENAAADISGALFDRLDQIQKLQRNHGKRIVELETLTGLHWT